MRPHNDECQTNTNSHHIHLTTFSQGTVDKIRFEKFEGTADEFCEVGVAIRKANGH